MRVSKIENNTNFCAKQVALASLKKADTSLKYSIYELSSRDSHFLSKLNSKINLPKLYPSLKQPDYEYWNFILNKAFGISEREENSAYLIANENKPCGILNYTRTKLGYNANFATTWPLREGKKEPLVGTILFLQLFNKLVNSKMNLIKLCAVRENSFNLIPKYLSLGFSLKGGNNTSEIMSITREKAEKVIQRYSDVVGLQEVDSEEIDLFEALEV